MSAGSSDNLIAGRYRAATPLAPIGGVDRYLAIDTESDTQVEVSVFTRSGPVPGGFGELAGRLHAAAHPSLAPILAWTEPGEDASLEALVVQPHLEGARLTSAVVLPRAVALAACADLADALTVLHHADLVHGDVTAAAVVLDTEGRAVLFGAGLAALQATAVDGVAADVDRDADMRGLGRVLYTLVCGAEPSRPLLAPLAHTPDISPALNGLIVSLLSDDPARPPPGAGVVASRLLALAAEAGWETLATGAVVDALPLVVDPEPPRPWRPSEGVLIAAAAGLCLFGVAAAFAITRTGKLTSTITVTPAALVTPGSSSFQPSIQSVVSTVAPLTTTITTAGTTTQTVVPPVTFSTPILPATTAPPFGAAGAATVVTDAVVEYNALTARGVTTYTVPVTATANGSTTVTTVTFPVTQSGTTGIQTYTQPVTVTVPR